MRTNGMRTIKPYEHDGALYMDVFATPPGFFVATHNECSWWITMHRAEVIFICMNLSNVDFEKQYQFIEYGE